MISILEIFYSLQGEASFSGMPCVFIRLAGCNLHCSYCDTPNAHDPGEALELSEILARVAAYPCHLVEITGGEPLCQRDALIPLLKSLLEQGYTVLMETNGSLSLAELPRQLVKIVDVKCPGSGEGESFLLGNLAHLEAHDEIKFVISDKADYNFALRFCSQHGLSGKRVIFSPVEGSLSPADLAAWMLSDGVKARLQLQLHKQLNIP